MNLLITGAINLNSEEISQIENIGYKVNFLQDETKKVNIDFSSYVGVICNSLFQYNDISEFKSLKFIQVTSAGLDRLPLEYIKKQKIKIYNAKDIYSIPMAEWTILKILEIYKNSKHFYESQKNKKWDKERNVIELNNKTATIVGYGSVGKEVAKRLKAFNVYTIGIGTQNDLECEYLESYYTIDEIEKALKISDIVILTLPLTEKTEKLFNLKLMNSIKDKSILINISRGKIINEKDLITLLNQAKFLGCALDVFENEPLSYASELWDLDNVIITPHNSFISELNKERIFKLIIKNLRCHIENINSIS